MTIPPNQAEQTAGALERGPQALANDPASETPSEAAKELRNEEANLAKELANPVASLISIPFQFNWDQRLGPEQSIQRANLNIQPVFPIKLSSDWNLISRTIVPVVDLLGAAGSETGQLHFGDTQQSLFLSPTTFGHNGLIWGVGPVALLPTATSSISALQQWGLGPTGVALVQRGPWSVGALANHLWSVVNNGSGENLNATYLQPFISYSTAGAWSISLNSESTYDWQSESWAVPLNLTVSKVTKLGTQLLSVGARLRYWVASPETGPHGWGGRLFVTLLFPKR